MFAVITRTCEPSESFYDNKKFPGPQDIRVTQHRLPISFHFIGLLLSKVFYRVSENKSL